MASFNKPQMQPVRGNSFTKFRKTKGTLLEN